MEIAMKNNNNEDDNALLNLAIASAISADNNLSINDRKNNIAFLNKLKDYIPDNISYIDKINQCR